MAAISINTGAITHLEELTYPNYVPGEAFYAAIEPVDVIGVIGTKEAIEETSQLMKSRAHLQELRVELERRLRRFT